MIYYNTKRLILRNWIDGDIEPFTKLNQDAEVMKYFPNLLSAEETIALVNKIKNKLATHGFGLYAVELKESHKFIGFIGINIPDFEAHFTPCVEIGWRLASEYWGHGLALEGAKKCFEIGFKEFRLNEIVSFTAKINHKSERVMQKLGMIHDKTDNFYHPKLPADHPLSEHILYRMRKEQWNQL